MAQSDERVYDIESAKIQASESAGSLRSSFQQDAYSSISNSIVSTGLDEVNALQWAAIQRLPTYDRVRSSLFDVKEGSTEDIPKRKKVVDVSKIGTSERHLFIERLIKHVDHDNLHFLQKIRKRMDKVGIQFPTVAVRYSDLHIEAECEVVHGKPLQTLWSSFKRLVLNVSGLSTLMSQIYKMNIIDGVSGVIKPGRMTLLLGPPGCGKSSLLKALTGNLGGSFKVTGEIAYNGYKLNELVPQKHSAYISQHDVHIPEMTVRETLDFSSRFQGVGSRAEMIKELIRREKEAGIFPDPDIDTYMKAISVEGQPKTLQTDYILKILGLDTCADILVGDAMRRGISGGQKKRLTTGEMISGPARVLFMDEISNGLDSSTTYQIVVCLQHLAHVTDATILISLLQPPPETFDLFDDIILLAEGNIVYHGSRDEVLEFFESCGFRCPERKGTAEFLQEVLSETDQAQYWYGAKETYTFHSVSILSRRFKASTYAHKLTEQLSLPLLKSKSSKDVISYSVYILKQWTICRACISREFLLMQRNSFVYIFKAAQLLVVAVMTMTVFFRTRMEKTDLTHANYYMGAIFFSIIAMHVDGFPELSMTLSRLDIFYKQRDLYFYPAWAYAIPSVILKVPLSLLPAIVWTSLTYFVIGYSPDIVRFFRHFLLLFCVHLWSISHFRFLASVTRSKVSCLAAADFFLVFILIFNGLVIPRHSMPVWLRWGFWISPFSYAEIGLAINEFLSPRWQKMLPTKKTVGQLALEQHDLNFDGNFFWIAIGALFGFIVLLNVGFILALIFLPSPGGRAIISSAKVSEIKRIRKEDGDVKNRGDTKPSRTFATESQKGRVVLPFEPLNIVFQDLRYYVDTPLETREHGSTGKRLEILRGITGSFRPGVLTAVMGVSGAGKTTLFDVLAGRKTSGTVEGEIKVGGYPKVQKTFARISGYCEQNDIHSPKITIEESVIFSAWLGLDPAIDSKTKSNFVKEVLATIELDGSKDALVGSLSSEQRKRLTIAVELVANPSILFLDEPTTGLDLRSTTIVMRAVKNVAETGRTVVCTIHQPSINIFESFDEVFVLKSGGRMIYSGPLGPSSCKMVEYFESIAGVPKLPKNYNPATWMLEVSSTSSEAALGVDFAEMYLHSALYRNNKQFAETFSSPQAGSKDLYFPTEFPQNGWCQFKACLWKHNLSYWRSPSYNLFRLLFIMGSSLLYGGLFWQQGKKLQNQQNLFTVFGSLFSAVMVNGIVNCSTVMPYVSTERSVLYRERFSGMYASWAYALAQVVVEIPYILVQVIIFTVVTYPMIGYYNSGYKVFWYMYSTFSSLLFFNYAGMMLVSITPSFSVAVVLQSALFSVNYLFSGFLVPRPQIPKWWIWLSYLTPSSWTLNGILTSQYGDIDKEIEVFGVTKTVSDFLRDYYGFRGNMLPIVGIVLLVYPLLFASVFALSIQYLNFQKR